MSARYWTAGLTALLMVACGGKGDDNHRGGATGGAGGEDQSTTGGGEPGGNDGATSGGSGGKRATGGRPGSAGAAGEAAGGADGGNVPVGGASGGTVVAGGAGGISENPTGGTVTVGGAGGAIGPEPSAGRGGEMGVAGNAPGGFPSDGGRGGAGTDVTPEGGSAGVPVDPAGGSSGAAGSPVRPTDVCGGIAGILCSSRRQYCRYDVGTCSDPDRSGRCVRRPDICLAEWSPVCGCNGITYTNSCEAARAGVSISHRDACTGREATTCGGLAGARCPAGTSCVYPIGTCSTVDGLGQCVQPPQTCPTVRDPVCSCTGDTFGNECLALLSRAAPLDHVGACR